MSTSPLITRAIVDRYLGTACWVIEHYYHYKLPRTTFSFGMKNKFKKNFPFLQNENENVRVLILCVCPAKSLVFL